MKLVSIRELRKNTAAIREDLKKEQKIVLTANGRPFAILTAANPETVEDQILASRRARARIALDRIRAAAQAQGADTMSMDEIDGLIAKVRRSRRTGK